MNQVAVDLKKRITDKFIKESYMKMESLWSTRLILKFSDVLTQDVLCYIREMKNFVLLGHSESFVSDR